MKEIFDSIPLKIHHYERISGGDINEAWCIYTEKEKYFLKINDAEKYPQMFLKEANGLNILRANTQLKIPGVIACGTANSKQYLLLNWIEKGTPVTKSYHHFGNKLAKMHLAKQPYFGFEEDNYIGSLIQVNKKYYDWPEFYSNCRILPLIKKLYNAKYFSEKDLLSAENFCKKIEHIFPDEPAALLHGDLWNGNYLIDESSHAVLIDPAAYNGHREMDIAMTRLFGGFPPEFYDGYVEIYPLENGWQERLGFSQLYPLLVHAILFGDHYIKNVKQIIQRF